MINFENNMLVLNNVFSKEDVNQINAYTDYVRNEERERIIKLLEDAQITEAELYDGRKIKVKSQAVRADLLIALIKNSGHTKDAS
jgi:hypothetical protein